MEKITKYLKYEFTETEMKEMSANMARATIENRNAADELKAVQAQFKSRIESAKNQADELARKIDQGYEYRNTECRVERDFAAVKVRVYRTDTGEMIESRDMTAKERQLRLDEGCIMEFVGGGETKEI